MQHPPPSALDEFRLAASLLTRLAVGPPALLPPGTLGRSVWALPLIGGLVGLISGLALLVADGLGLGVWAVALVAVAAELLVTGAFHEDGLADVADGFGGGRDAPAKLAIMRDSRIGTYGAAALWVALTGRLVALAQIGGADGVDVMFWALIAANAGARAAILLPMALLPPARADGLGASVGEIDPERALSGGVFALGIGLVCLGWGVVTAALLTIAAGALMTGLARRQIGGYSGDVFGATAQVALVAILLGVAAVG
ncbi:adenosylcobinamide-GDP ribazoletransferase [Oleomonas cavernae]|uniref:Adenosylcobinamide-GDP ribazoletransferase n=1 Tax=Oleomonas cavernae TaxID=2320859 RepID=A0A418WTP7_9PROT|nr:adenosylcobinamide-GDP ribazoletransferase [Oleomonas cavernae]RJF94641.1 adenosylcobinamide-GDP ribazoletransferase [Oleomonas cavernae]